MSNIAMLALRPWVENNELTTRKLSKAGQEICRQLGLFQEELAHSFATVNCWENGKRAPSKLARRAARTILPEKRNKES
jgi:hypothetical protein